MLRLPEGKMSSRKGNVIPAEELIDLVSERIKDRLEDMKVEGEDKVRLVNDIAVGAIKFSILKSAPGKDMIFDFEKSLSFEGDSGPYLQYTHARLCALLAKAEAAGIDTESYAITAPERELEQVIIGYAKTLEKSYKDLGPHHLVQYLLSLTRAFNNLYGRKQIVDENDKEASGYYVMLATATRNILAHGLHALGIAAPQRM
jgi:arginyl-tRNA synthetase